MKLSLRVLGLVLLCAAVTAAQEPKQNPQSPARTVVLDIDVLDVNLDQRGEIEKIVKDKRSLDRFIAEGKARPIAAIQVRARNGEQASTRMGQRVPVQSVTTTQGTPQQIQYENTGLNVDVEPRMVESDRISIKLKIELSAVVRNENVLAPTFVQRTVNDFVNVRPGEPVVLVSVTQHEALLPAPKSGSKPGEQAGGNFVIVLTARLLD